MNYVLFITCERDIHVNHALGKKQNTHKHIHAYTHKHTRHVHGHMYTCIFDRSFSRVFIEICNIIRNRSEHISHPGCILYLLRQMRASCR